MLQFNELIVAYKYSTISKSMRTMKMNKIDSNCIIHKILHGNYEQITLESIFSDKRV